MIGLLITLLVAVLVYWLLAALTGSAIVAIVGALLVLIAGIPSGGFGFGGRWTHRDRPWCKPEVGLEPTHSALQERCSTN